MSSLLVTSEDDSDSSEYFTADEHESDQVSATTGMPDCTPLDSTTNLVLHPGFVRSTSPDGTVWILPKTPSRAIHPPPQGMSIS